MIIEALSHTHSHRRQSASRSFANHSYIAQPISFFLRKKKAIPAYGTIVHRVNPRRMNTSMMRRPKNKNFVCAIWWNLKIVLRAAIEADRRRKPRSFSSMRFSRARSLVRLTDTITQVTKFH